MIITPSFFETFLQGYHPGRNAGLQSGDIRSGGRPEALSHVFIQTACALLQSWHRAADLSDVLRHSIHVADDLLQVFERVPELGKRGIQVPLGVLKKSLIHSLDGFTFRI
jgi:hypothetical protein